METQESNIECTVHGFRICHMQIICEKLLIMPMFYNKTTVKDVMVLIKVTCLKLTGFDWFI